MFFQISALKHLFTHLLFLLGFLCLIQSSSLYAEGSRSLYPADYPAYNSTNEASRANLDLEPGNYYLGIIQRSTFLYVYAKQGEYILLGSSNMNAGGDILVFNPQNFGIPGNETVPPASSANFSCAATGTYSGNGRGYISSRTEELAGPGSADGTVTAGYTPCAYLVPSSGIYGVQFTAASSGSGPNGSVAIVAPSNISVSAWDVSVRDSAASTADLNGRIFTYTWTGYTSNSNERIYSTLYYISSDGYRYSQQLDGFDPYGFALYANSLGFLDNGQPLYKDIRGNTAYVQNLPAGITGQYPQYPIFFSDITPNNANETNVDEVLTALGIPINPNTPIVSNLSFNGHVGGVVTTPGVGGVIQFSTTYTITYQIVISQDGVNFDPGAVTNRVLTGIALAGTHQVTWDGKDNSGNNFPAKNGNYSFNLSGQNGNIHFPMIDVEGNKGGGPTITRLNGLSSPDTTVFFDDRGYRTSSGELIGNLNGTLCPNSVPVGPSPDYSLLGVDSTTNGDSTTNYRYWPSNGNYNHDCSVAAGFGDAKALDLWTAYYTPTLTSHLQIQALTIDVATNVISPNNASAGNTVYGSVSFENYGSSTAHGVTYSLSMPAGLGTVTFSNLPGGYSASYNNTTGVVTFNGFPTSLTAGESIPNINFSYTAPTTQTSVAVQASISTTDKDNNPSNNISSKTTYIGPTDLMATVSLPAQIYTGSPVIGNLYFANIGADTAYGVTYSVTIGSPGDYPASVTFTNLPDHVTATYNPSNGSISFSGLPSTFGSGETINIEFTYTPTIAGTIAVSSTISTTSFDSNLTNNTAQSSTKVQNALHLIVSDSAPRCDRPVLLTTSGGSPTGTVTFAAVPSGGASCHLYETQGKWYLKITSTKGSCAVTATKNTEASNTINVTVH